MSDPSTTTLPPAAQGCLQGAFVGDALALGPHWMYDRAEIVARFGRVAGLQAPATTYHPGKQAGDYTHLGDQMVLLLESLKATQGRFDAADFMQRWTAFWKNPATQSYPDKATRNTLAQIDAGTPLLEAGFDSEELAGPARGLVALGMVLAAGAGLEEIMNASRAQTRLTHRSALAEDVAAFLARLVFLLGKGNPLPGALQVALAASSAKLQSLVRQAEAPAVANLFTGDAVEALGQSCSLTEALPASILILRRHGHSYEEALVENVMAGGDSAARGILIGGVLGLVHGVDGIPAAWRSGLRRPPL